MNRIEPLANEYLPLYESDVANGEYCYTPALCNLGNGRIIATCEHTGPDPQKRGMVYLSENDAKSFRFTGYFPMGMARPFEAGGRVYILGQMGHIYIVCSEDGGKTWSEAARLTPEDEEGSWHQSGCNVWYKGDFVYLVMEHRVSPDCISWPVAAMAPVLMRANVHDDLMKPESWTFASELFFRDEVDQEQLDWFGVPFFQVPRGGMIDTVPEGHTPRRTCAPIGWLESNVVQIMDPKHYWYDPTGRTFHIFMRAHTGGTGYACLCKAVEKDDGTIETCFETVPSGRRIVFLPLPGGQMRFHMLYDEKTQLYWLLSTQATDSMTRSELLEPDRYNLPNNERRRLVLHFSKNCVDWIFAGMVAQGDGTKESRHYAGMVIDGEDLLILSRSGDYRAATAHNGNLITLHRVKDFRSLVY